MKKKKTHLKTIELKTKHKYSCVCKAWLIATHLIVGKRFNMEHPVIFYSRSLSNNIQAAIVNTNMMSTQ